MNFISSSHEQYWLYHNVETLYKVRKRANEKGISMLKEAQQKRKQQQTSSEDETTTATDQVFPVQNFARGYLNPKTTKDTTATETTTTTTTNLEEEGDDYLTVEEEVMLIRFYVGYLRELIGPEAAVSRLRRDSKVMSTAAMLCKRFFLSNSVVCFDPKLMMVAAAFLASKVEDATVDVRYLEEATKRLSATVQLKDIIAAELQLLDGLCYDLNVFHPYKTVLALTEDLRHFFKSSKKKIVGEDLRPIHDTARNIVHDLVITSDLPLLYTPGQIGLASMMVANRTLLLQQQQQQSNAENSNSSSSYTVPNIDFKSYMIARFQNQYSTEQVQSILQQMELIVQQIQEFLANHANVNMEELKRVHKKVKQLKGVETSKKKKKDKKSKQKKKKRKLEETVSTTA